MYVLKWSMNSKTAKAWSPNWYFFTSCFKSLCKFIRWIASHSLLFNAESLWKAPTHFHLTLPPVLLSAGLIFPFKSLTSATSPHWLNAECLHPAAPGLSLEPLWVLTYQIFQSSDRILCFHQVMKGYNPAGLNSFHSGNDLGFGSINQADYEKIEKRI